MKQANKFKSIALYLVVMLILLWGLAFFTGGGGGSGRCSDGPTTSRRNGWGLSWWGGVGCG